MQRFVQFRRLASIPWLRSSALNKEFSDSVRKSEWQGLWLACLAEALGVKKASRDGTRERAQLFVCHVRHSWNVDDALLVSFAAAVEDNQR